MVFSIGVLFAIVADADADAGVLLGIEVALAADTDDGHVEQLRLQLARLRVLAIETNLEHKISFVKFTHKLRRISHYITNLLRLATDSCVANI